MPRLLFADVCEYLDRQDWIDHLHCPSPPPTEHSASSSSCRQSADTVCVPSGAPTCGDGQLRSGVLGLARSVCRLSWAVPLDLPTILGLARSICRLSWAGPLGLPTILGLARSICRLSWAGPLGLPSILGRPARSADYPGPGPLDLPTILGLARSICRLSWAWPARSADYLGPARSVCRLS